LNPYLLSSIPDIQDISSLLVSFSGGPDSTFLIQILKKKFPHIKLFLIYFNHQLREKNEIENEKKHIISDALKQKLPLTIKALPVKPFAKKYHLSIEMAGHHLRHYFLCRYMKRYRCNAIATGHHLDDVCETIFLNQDLARIPIKTTIDGCTFLKPLLYFNKKEILSFLDENKIKYCIDSTNTQTVYKRNSIRKFLSDKILDYDFYKKNHVVSQHLNQLYDVKKYADYWLIPLKEDLKKENPVDILSSIQHTLRWTGKTPLDFCEFRYTASHIQALSQLLRTRRLLSPISMPTGYKLTLTIKGLVLTYQ
jgi:tRNA(Ile)-lysidine synthase